MAALSIRKAQVADAAALSEIGTRTFVETFGHLYPEPDLNEYLVEAYDIGETRAGLEHPQKASWLVEDEGEVVGFATAGLSDLPHADIGPRSYELKRFYLLKARQNGGIGSTLFHEVMDWMLAQDPLDLWIGVWSENTGAQRFYQRHGFERVGEYGFKVGATVDHEFILRKTLIPAH
jgi:ribosomal protein S18 acetylase RimI-like enzyme